MKEIPSGVIKMEEDQHVEIRLNIFFYKNSKYSYEP
jgi:hypothetical protein